MAPIPFFFFPKTSSSYFPSSSSSSSCLTTDVSLTYPQNHQSKHLHPDWRLFPLMHYHFTSEGSHVAPHEKYHRLQQKQAHLEAFFEHATPKPTEVHENSTTSKSHRKAHRSSKSSSRKREESTKESEKTPSSSSSNTTAAACTRCSRRSSRTSYIKASRQALLRLSFEIFLVERTNVVDPGRPVYIKRCSDCQHLHYHYHRRRPSTATTPATTATAIGPASAAANGSASAATTTPTSTSTLLPRTATVYLGNIPSLACPCPCVRSLI